MTNFSNEAISIRLNNSLFSSKQYLTLGYHSTPTNNEGLLLPSVTFRYHELSSKGKERSNSHFFNKTRRESKEGFPLRTSQFD